ncbi:LysR substrate-binding domain-containing protein [Pseudofrankia sp. BMG5.37]|uniref:LysR substrate-binding domain-containing protein n=1 Tax=Pseudofrankia sp. BMG5.37 TaxID=3050035 RepID=UPI00289401B5|nr:LysR substrate-binding domain-containing protein [Pseudofrankia sp. BMG5.37]MDT3440084.1 LysR substrate-binding domain-containing protein [Pseudofrankia sp. BMG5.37]
MERPQLLDGRLKIRHLVLVDAIASAGSVVRAAERLHVTQPVATRALHEVESILGVRLYDRGPRGLAPTAFGEAFVDHARAVLAQLRSASDHLAELAGADAGTVAVGTYLAGSNLLLPLAIGRLKSERPKVTVIVREANPEALTAELLAGTLDLVVGRLTVLDDAERLRQETLYREPIRLVARTGHPAATRTSQIADLPGSPPDRLPDLPDRLPPRSAEPIEEESCRQSGRDPGSGGDPAADPAGTPGAARLADLIHYPWVVPVAETALRRELEAAFLREALPLPADRVECMSILTTRHLLLHTDSIAALPELVIRDEPGLCHLPVALPSLGSSVGVTEPAGRPPTPAARALADCLRAAAADLRAPAGT